MDEMKSSVMCPWTSSAPIQSYTKIKLQDNNPDAKNVESPSESENHTDGMQKTKPEVDIKHTSTQFFHFLRLMQLFPNVHPATLHTVMNLCKNDFFIAVDKLLYAKRCKELYNNRRNLIQSFSNKRQRYSQQQQVIKVDAKKICAGKGASSRGSSNKVDVGGVEDGLTPVALQCNVPLGPLSPQDLSPINGGAAKI